MFGTFKPERLSSPRYPTGVRAPQSTPAPAPLPRAHDPRQVPAPGRPGQTGPGRAAAPGGQLKIRLIRPNRPAPNAVSDSARALRGHALAVRVRAATTKVW
jgi:hypothetical protein